MSGDLRGSLVWWKCHCLLMLNTVVQQWSISVRKKSVIRVTRPRIKESKPEASVSIDSVDRRCKCVVNIISALLAPDARIYLGQARVKRTYKQNEILLRKYIASRVPRPSPRLALII